MSRTPKPLKSYPRSNDQWFVGVSRMDISIADQGPSADPHVLYVVSHDSGMILQLELLMQAPKARDVAAVLARAVREPHGPGMNPSWPSLMVGAEEEIVGGLMQFARDEGLDCEVGEMPEPPEIKRMLADLNNALGGPPELPSLTDIQGVTLELLAGFFEAAAEFYRAAPWVRLSNHQTLAVRHPAERDYRYVLTMGQGGVEYGLNAYRRWDDLERLFSEDIPVVDRMPEDGALSLTYGSKHEALAGDAEAAKRHRWKIAGARAHPITYVVNNQGAVSRPTVADLHWLEAALRAIPAFVSAHLKPDGRGEYLAAEAVITVKTHAGPAAVGVKYPGGTLHLGDLPAQEDDGVADDMPVFDRRIMEGDMAALIGGMAPRRRGKKGKLDEAQELIYQAFDDPNPATRIALAHDALVISPDCTDAYVLLAEEEAPTVEKMLEYYRAGVAAGERALGKKFFKEHTGRFWGLLETRPYMRARLGVATSLQRMHQYDDAVREMVELLHLNPGDNQGVRDILINLLMFLDRNKEVDSLLKAYPDSPTAVWQYTIALQAFKRGGESKEANKALKIALKDNPHVVPYLAGRKRVPVERPPYIGFGDESEAVYYVQDHLNYWRRVDGAVDWLKAQSTAVKRPSAKRQR